MCDLPIPGLYGAQAAQASIAEEVSTGQVETLSANSEDGRVKFYPLYNQRTSAVKESQERRAWKYVGLIFATDFK
jgi:hypothetical protein